MKPPQNAFPHPVTSASAPDWSSLKKAGTRHVSPVSASCATAPFAPRRTHTILAPAAARRRHSSSGEPFPTRDTASSSFGEKTSPAEHSASSVSRGTGRVARVNGSTLSHPAFDAPSLASPPPRLRRKDARSAASGRSGCTPTWNARAPLYLGGSVSAGGRSMAYRPAFAGVRHTCVRRPSRSVICHARGVGRNVCASGASFFSSSFFRSRRATNAEADASPPPPSRSAAPYVSMSSSRTSIRPSLSTPFASSQSSHSRGKSGPIPAARPTEKFPGCVLNPNAVCGPPPPSTPMRVEPSANTRSSTITVNTTRSRGGGPEGDGSGTAAGRVRVALAPSRFPRTRGTRRPAASPVARPRRGARNKHARDETTRACVAAAASDMAHRAF